MLQSEPLPDLYQAPHADDQSVGAGIPRDAIGDILPYLLPFGVGIDCLPKFFIVDILTLDSEHQRRLHSKRFTYKPAELFAAKYWIKQVIHQYAYLPIEEDQNLPIHYMMGSPTARDHHLETLMDTPPWRMPFQLQRTFWKLAGTPHTDAFYYALAAMYYRLLMSGVC